MINGEYGRSNIVGGIPRRSPAPPVVDPSNPESVSALAEFVAERTPGQDGFYSEGTYRFSPHLFRERLDEGGYIAPVVRYEVVRVDRTIPNFYLNRSRTTLWAQPRAVLDRDFQVELSIQSYIRSGTSCSGGDRGCAVRGESASA